MDYTYRQLIGGKWLPSANSVIWAVENPATEEPVREVPFGDAADCRLALEAAAAAFPKWSRSTAYERAAVLKRAAELIRERAGEMGRTTVLESGKPFVQAKGEWSVAADLFEWFAEEGKRAYGRVIPSRNPARRLLVLRQPVGVVGIITAWNFPIYNIARAAAAALAAGCTVVLRPSEYTPLTAMELVNVLIEAGIPEGVVNLVNGEPAAMGQEMLSNPLCAKIHFTGSPRVGRLLMDGASRTVTRLSLELGGNAPVLIFPDVDLDQVAAGAVVAKFRNGGQVCVSPQRFFVHRSIAAGFAERVAELAGKLCLGNGLDLATQVGPLINARQRDRVEGLVDQAVSAGAQVLTGARRPPALARGYFYEPTVLTEVAADSALFSDEIFGPVLPIAAFDETAEAIERANATRAGLSAYVWTNDLRIARETTEALEFGLIGLNDWSPQATEGPFAGWKESGIGRESGQEGLDEYLETKLISTGGAL
jgi:acyl-CoA reductase-like NAD-dependent aldehyde dehydrogenase